ncbi:MAG: ATP-binding protein, partial [Rhabdochlamydiaceae bacterium]
MYILREIEELLEVALKQFPACLITGPRQAGKSTLLQNKLKNYRYVTLDDPLIRSMANEDPKLFLGHYKPPLIIDEIQYAPSLLPYLKIIIDQNRDQYGQYVLTGSQIFQLMKGVSESLAGRIAIFNLFPLSWEEILKIPNHSNDSLDDRRVAHQIVQGFYPELFTHPKREKELWFSSYLSTYVER